MGAGIDATYGAAFLGLLGSAVLYGVTLLQTYLYYKTYPKDSFFLKFIIAFLWFLDTMHLILCAISIYDYLVTNFNDPSALGKSTWGMNLQTDCNGLIGLIVEIFFARRVWILSRNIWLTAVIVVLAWIHFGLGVYFTVQGFLLVEVKKFGALIWVTTTGLGSAAAADVIIAAALCYYLMKNRTGFSRTDSIITTLIAYSLTTGLITSVIALICVICFALMPTNYIWLGFFWLIGKCYVNSILAALNSRDSLREQVSNQKMPDGTLLQLTPFRNISQIRSIDSPPSPSDDKGGLAVNVQTQTITKTDYDYMAPPPPPKDSQV